MTRNECDKLAGDLRQTGIQAISYHAGLSDPERARVQEDWIRDRCKVFCYYPCYVLDKEVQIINNWLS